MNKKHSNLKENCNQWSEHKKRCLAERYKSMYGKGCTCINNPETKD